MGLSEIRRRIAARDAVRGVLAAASTALVAAVETDPRNPAWPQRRTALEPTWRWARAATWIDSRGGVDVDAVQQEIRDVEDAIRHHVQELSATRAWGHAVHPGRLTPRAKASLQQYATLVRRFGKTGGKYREQRRADIRAHGDATRIGARPRVACSSRVHDSCGR